MSVILNNELSLLMSRLFALINNLCTKLGALRRISNGFRHDRKGSLHHHVILPRSRKARELKKRLEDDGE